MAAYEGFPGLARRDGIDLLALDAAQRRRERRLDRLEAALRRVEWKILLGARDDTWFRLRLQTHASLYRDTLEWVDVPGSWPKDVRPKLLTRW